MIVLNLIADNFFEFNDFHINFTYPKKVVNSTISNEYLSYCPTFRYKKFVMIMGANASGKTTLGKLLRAIVNFINFKEYSHIVSCIKDNRKSASFSIDFIDDSRKMYRLETVIDANKNNDYNSKDIHTNVRSISIKKNDNYEKCVKRIENISSAKIDDYISELEKIGKISWMFKFAIKESNTGTNDNYNSKTNYIELLERTLKVLDPRILEVSKVANSKETYLIKYENRTVILKEGKIVDDDTLSSGTREGISIAHLVACIKHDLYKFYYCDEKFSHVHTDTEKAFISLMIECLCEDNQLIMTSHNTEVLDTMLPKHSFAFLKRDDNLNVSCVYASDYLKRNTDSIKCAVDNDVFGTSPNVDDIYKLKGI